MIRNRLTLAGVWVAGAVLGLALAAGRGAVAAEAASASGGRSGQNADVEALVEKLREISRIGYGYSALFSGSEFLPYADSATVHTLVIGSQRPERSKTLEAIVRHGAEAVPVLLKHLDDGRKTRIPPLEGFPSFADEYDYNRRTRKEPPAGVNRETFGEKAPPSHTLTVGDLCFVALGQIVNRNFSATRVSAQQDLGCQLADLFRPAALSWCGRTTASSPRPSTGRC